ncbi:MULTISPECIES: hypothetical protein [unclassified Caulobacter]|nr:MULTISPECIES: hypothetical protein [unclassified Caulobacter]
MIAVTPCDVGVWALAKAMDLTIPVAGIGGDQIVKLRSIRFGGVWEKEHS